MKWKIDRKIRKGKIFSGDLKQLKELFQGEDYYKFLILFYYNFGLKIDRNYFTTRTLTAEELGELMKTEIGAGFVSLHLALRKRKGISRIVAHILRFYSSSSPEEANFYSYINITRLL